MNEPAIKMKAKTLFQESCCEGCEDARFIPNFPNYRICRCGHVWARRRKGKITFKKMKPVNRLSCKHLSMKRMKEAKLAEYRKGKE